MSKETEDLLAEIERLKKERDYAVRWANRSVDSVKQSMQSREVILFRHLPDYLQNQVNEELIRLEEEGE